MRVYFTETRDEEGKFYRFGDWGIEKPDEWDNKKGNWTDQAPSEETLKHGVPCDFVDGEWILDTDSDEYKSLHAVKRKPLYPTTDELIVALWEKVMENRPESADKLQTLRESVKQQIPKSD